MAENGDLKVEKSSVKKKVNQFRQCVNAALGEAHGDDACSLLSASTHASSNGGVGSLASMASSKRDTLITRLQVARATSQLQIEEDQLEYQAKELDREKSRQRDQLELEKRKLQRRKETEAIAAELAVVDDQIDPLLAQEDLPFGHPTTCEVDKEQNFVNHSLSVPLEVISTRVNPSEAVVSSSSYSPQNPFLGGSGLEKQFFDRDVSGWHTKNHSPLIPGAQSFQDILQGEACDRPTYDAISPLQRSTPHPTHSDPSWFLARRELFQKSGDPFSGAGQEDRFHLWVSLLQAQLQGIVLSPVDEIRFLIANTAGEANKLVKDFKLREGAILRLHLYDLAEAT
jgi:hypothetical protein